MRLFFAVEFDESLKDAIARAIEEIGVEDPPWRWVARHNFHITLKFLGETREERVKPLVMSAVGALRQMPPFQIQLGALGGFPTLRRPRVLFYQVNQGADELTALAERLDLALNNDLAVERDRRPFRAHATVARVKTPIDARLSGLLEAAPGVDHPPQIVDRVRLMRSQLRREGALYHVVKEIAFE